MCATAKTFQMFPSFISFLFALLMITNAIGDNKAPIRCLERERTALLQLKQGLIDDYGYLSSWRGEECCEWQGVECSNLTAHVLTLDLNQFWLEGTLSIGNLTHLQTLDLGNNYFENVENLEWLSNLRAIRYLDLSWIDLSNTTNWLQLIQNLSLLTELHLLGCQIRLPLTPLHNYSYMPILSVIDLSSNDFNSSSQPLFHWLYNLSSTLVDVDVSYNNIQGPIPDVFRNITHLQSLDLGNNNFTGDLSEVLNKWSKGAKNSIEVLNLAWNELSGSLPDFSRFSSLKKFSVSNNKLTEPLPDYFGQHPSSLVFLDLSNNLITGSLPNQLLFHNLEYLDLSNNTLKGRLPESIGHFSKLITLDVSLNSFEDTITEIHFVKLSSLRVLDLSFNSLVLNVSLDWIPPFQLDVIALGNCKLGPHFPKWLQTQNSCSVLHIPHANISGVIPNWFWNLSPVLEFLNVASNQMSGVIPDLSSGFPYLSVIDLSTNQFNGSIPLLPSLVQSLDVSKNGFSRQISSVCDLSGIEYLDLSDNLFSGDLPDCWQNLIGLMILNLANNNFTGKIPSSFGSLYSLESVHLRNNNFIGELPVSLKDCRGLKLFDLGGNKLSGRIPEWIGMYMKDLIIFSISQNKFYGSIPSNICSLKNIQILDLSQNSISGYVPRCFNNFTSLTDRNESVEIIISTYRKPYYYEQHIHQCLGRRSQNHCQAPDINMDIDSSIVQWKGQSAEFVKTTLKQLKVIDLSSNKLTGQILDELVSLVDLRSLNLSRNYFTGHIPQKIGQMKTLESLDLSRNLLSGEIPMGLGTLAFLSVLDLSNNNLSGKIPPGTQLEGFNSTVYADNLELCGFPLPNKCPGVGGDLVPPTSKDKNGEDEEEDGDDELITLGFYVSLILGFAVGFWGVFGTLQLKQSWRRALFQFLNDMKDRVYVVAAVNLARIKRMHTG